MDLTAAAIDEAVREYPDVQPLSAVEHEHLELLPEAFASGEYGWRDAEWVVQWYYRRFLGGYPDADRRAAEDAYGENGFEAVRTAIADTTGAASTEAALAALTDLEGVDVPVASAFLQFVDPTNYVVVGEREWGALARAGELEEPYPVQPTPRGYELYLTTCRTITSRLDRSLWDLYRALWVDAVDRPGGILSSSTGREG